MHDQGPGDGLDDDDIRAILGRPRRIALVGASADPWRPSNDVLRSLLAAGHDVTPVNPAVAGQLVHGRLAVAMLHEAAPLDVVDVFRASAHVPALAAEAVRLGARVLWLQLGVRHPAAEAEARAAGLVVVAGRCPKIEAARLGLRPALKPAADPATSA